MTCDAYNMPGSQRACMRFCARCPRKIACDMTCVPGIVAGVPDMRACRVPGFFLKKMHAICSAPTTYYAQQQKKIRVGCMALNKCDVLIDSPEKFLKKSFFKKKLENQK